MKDFLSDCCQHEVRVESRGYGHECKKCNKSCKAVPKRLTYEDLDFMAEHEAKWLKAYTWSESMKTENFEDVGFYDRLVDGYSKRRTPLYMRCPYSFITGEVSMIESRPDQLWKIGEIRNHSKNIFTPLEYVLMNKVGRHEYFKNILKA